MSEKTNEVKKTDKKGNFFSGIGKFFREYRSELKKISWPTFAEVVKNTIITLCVVLFVGIIVWLVDWGVSAVRDTLISTVEKIDPAELLNKETSNTDIEGILSESDLEDIINQISDADVVEAE